GKGGLELHGRYKCFFVRIIFPRWLLACLHSPLMDLDRYRAICDYVEFTEQTSSVLRALSPFVDPHLPRLIDDFYEAIDRDERARQVIAGGDAQVARLKVTLLRWLRTLLAGPHDEAYVESRNQIGRVHVRIGLPQEYMFTAANRLRNALLALVFTESR